MCVYITSLPRDAARLDRAILNAFPPRDTCRSFRPVNIEFLLSDTSRFFFPTRNIAFLTRNSIQDPELRYCVIFSYFVALGPKSRENKLQFHLPFKTQNGGTSNFFISRRPHAYPPNEHSLAHSHFHTSTLTTNK